MEKKDLFAEWLATPKKLRRPRTQKELADLLDVQPETLSRWKSEEVFQDVVFENARARLGGELGDILQVIAEKAKEGQIQFVKLALELTNRHSEKITVKTEAPDLGIEQYTAVIRKVAQWERERFGDR